MGYGFLKFIAAATSMTVCLTTACNKERHNSRSVAKPAGGATVVNDGDATIGLTSKVAMRNFAQINATMAALTGVSVGDPVAVKFYSIIETQLPLSNDIESFLPSHQVSLAKLAIGYCDLMVSRPELSANILGNFAINDPPVMAFVAAQRALLIEVLTEKFWGTGLNSLPEKNSTSKALNELIDELLIGEDNTKKEVTAKIVKGVCTAVLSSAPVSMF